MSIFHGITSLFPSIIFGLTLFFTIVQLYYIIFVYGKLALVKIKQPTEKDRDLPGLSVIISAYNEEDNLKKHLPVILEQEYPNYEVVVINDCSEDETKWVLKDLEAKYPHLKVIEIQEHVKLKHNKKFALTIGIKAAIFDHFLFTDADCEPASSQWLRGMASHLDDQKEIVLGYSPYYKSSGFLNRLIRFETSHTAMSYLSYALKGSAYMGVGRNLGYTKNLFYQGKGFTSHMHVKSGDDDLFVNQNATKRNVAIAIHPDEFVYSLPKATWKSYHKQKGRHSTASKLYKDAHKFMLGTQLISALLFYVFIIVSVCLFPKWWFISLGLYLLRLIAQLLVFSSVYKKLHTKDLLVWLPLLDIFYYFFICFNGLFNRNKKQVSWK